METLLMIRKTGFLLLLFLMVVVNAFAQSEHGKTFYVAFANNNNKTSVNDVELKLKVVAALTTEVRLSYTNGSVSDVVFTVPAGTVYDYTLTTAEKTASYVTSSSVSQKTIKVTASNPIVLYASNCTSKSADVTRVLPVEDWGTLYYKNAQFDPSGQDYAGVIVIAKENGTTITTTLGGATLWSNFTLQAGEMRYLNTYLYQGTKIESNNKDFAFFESAVKAEIDGQTSYQFAQLPPVSQWGTQYVIPSNIYNGYYARIVAKEITNVNVVYTDGSTDSFQLNPAYSTLRYKDLNYRGALKRACYVTSDKPIGICVFLKPESSSLLLPSMSPVETWLPSLNQQERNVIINPFSFNTNYLFGCVNHHVIIITPTFGKEQTTVSINGALPQTLNHPMTWIADNIGGSGYSFARYELGDNQNPSVMNTAFQFDNPNGMIVLAYGNDNQGGSYFYTGGGSAMNLTEGFTVNGENYFNVNGHVYNSGTNFVFNAFPNTLTNIKWELNGCEIQGSFNQITVNVNNLPNGYYTLVMTVFLGTEKKIFSTFFHVGEKPTVVSSNVSSANQGSKFYVTFARIDTISTIKRNYSEEMKRHNVELILRMTAFETTGVNLSFTHNHTLDTTLTISAGITDYILPYERACAAYLGNSSYPYNMKKTILVTSTSPMTLHAISTANASVEATMVFPVKNWGHEYYNISIDSKDLNNAAGYIVIADEDNTKVDFLRGNLGGFIDYSRTLNKGEVEYVFLPGIVGSHSLTKLHIKADKPIGYFETNTSGKIGALTNHTFEQMASVNQWGKEFIVPTGTSGSICMRMIGNESTVVNIYYSNGTNETVTLERWQYYYKDVTLSGSRNACYIVSDKPICIAVYHINGMQPGEAWLPPVEQRVHNILLSPLDINGIHAYLTMRHDVMIITPTVGRENTTVSINGDFPQQLNHPMTWIADDIGGSGYSFARYYLGKNEHGESLKTTFLFDNPNGVLVLAYGQGSYTNYFYTAGYGGYDLGSAFTVKGTIFPFVNTGNSAFDNLFTTTVKLYAIPPATIIDKIGYLRKQTPIYTTVATYYDCNVDEPIVRAPKNPGSMGVANNPGLSIRWEVLGIANIGVVDTTTLTKTDKCPSSNIGKYIFKNVASGEYVIEISRLGFLTRYGVINVTNDDYLGHRELLGGDVNGDMVVNEKDISAIRNKSDVYKNSTYKSMYDLNGNGIIDSNDSNIVRFNFNAFNSIYQETRDFINR